MILILSFDEYEQGTDPVIDWLLYYKAEFVKITVEDFIQKKQAYRLEINDGRIFIKGEDVTDKIKVIWYRRLECDVKISLPKNKPFTQALFEINQEIIDTITYLKRILAHKTWMPQEEGFRLNKLEVTYLAQQFNIATPTTIVSNNKQDVLEFQRTVDCDLIVKPIKHSSYFITPQHTYSIYTQKLKKEDVGELPEQFVLTLFQACIEAAYEIRVFYLDGTCYASAIILTTDQSDTVDIKLNFYSENIHWIPYQLPIEYESKLIAFMQSIHLNTGSLDIIKSKAGEYIMLEVNPVGQYNAPSYRCNYNLEEKIAKWLINHDT